eukprot:510759-Pyramimonas_sp.AAC.1
MAVLGSPRALLRRRCRCALGRRDQLPSDKRPPLRARQTRHFTQKRRSLYTGNEAATRTLIPRRFSRGDVARASAVVVVVVVAGVIVAEVGEVVVVGE